MILPESLSFASASLAFSLFLVTGSVCFGVLVIAMVEFREMHPACTHGAALSLRLVRDGTQGTSGQHAPGIGTVGIERVGSHLPQGSQGSSGLLGLPIGHA